MLPWVAAGATLRMNGFLEVMLTTIIIINCRFNRVLPALANLKDVLLTFMTSLVDDSSMYLSLLNGRV